MKKKLGWSTIFYELKGVVKAKIAENNSQVSEGGITVKPGQDSIHELIIWKVNPFVASVSCGRYQIAFKWSVKFWLQLFSIRWDGKYFNGWNFYLGILQIQENWAGRKFYNELACVFTAHDASKNADWNQQLTDGGILGNWNSANHPYCFLSNRKKVQILAFLHVIRQRNVSCPLLVRDFKR